MQGLANERARPESSRGRGCRRRLLLVPWDSRRTRAGPPFLGHFCDFHRDPSTGPLPPLQKGLLPQPGLQWDIALSGITHSLSGVSLHLIPLRCLQAALPLSTSRQQCPGWVEEQPSLTGAMLALLPDKPLWPHLGAFRLVLLNSNTPFCDL